MICGVHMQFMFYFYFFSSLSIPAINQNWRKKNLKHRNVEKNCQKSFLTLTLSPSVCCVALIFLCLTMNAFLFKLDFRRNALTLWIIFFSLLFSFKCREIWEIAYVRPSKPNRCRQVIWLSSIWGRCVSLVNKDEETKKD